MGFDYKGLEKEKFYEIVDMAISQLERTMERLQPNSPDIEDVYIHMLYTHQKMMEGFFNTKDSKILEQTEKIRSLIMKLQNMRINATAM
jgi:hypothetical protein